MEEKGENVARDGVGHPLLVDGGDGLLDLGHPVVEYQGGRGQREGQRQVTIRGTDSGIIGTIISWNSSKKLAEREY